MYFVKKRMEIAGAHKLDLPYKSKCTNLHGHNWIVTVHCVSKELTDFGMVVDFKHIKNAVHDKLDHQYLNEVLNGDFNPTAENLAHYICHHLNMIEDLRTSGMVYRVDVQESEGNTATYISDAVCQSYNFTPAI